MLATNTAPLPVHAALKNLVRTARAARVPADALNRFLSFGYVPQTKQLLFHAAARSCDFPKKAFKIGFGGARGGGKTHAIFAQLVEDCCRVPGLKCLFLRRVGKAARESFNDLRRRLLYLVPHTHNGTSGVVEFQNGSRIFLGHFNHDSDIDNYLGLEYDVIAVEEATQLTKSKVDDLATCNRSSSGFRPRMYFSTNPGGIGHLWFKKEFIEPFREGCENETRFIPATFRDNSMLNAEYVSVLNKLTGWKLKAWRDGDWDVMAGQFFANWRRDLHVRDLGAPIDGFPVWAAMDYGFNHPTVCYPAQKRDGLTYIFDEFWARKQLVPQNAAGIKAMLERNNVELWNLQEFVAGSDVFARRSDSKGKTIAEQYEDEGINLTPADMDRINGAGELLRLLGDAENNIDSTFVINPRCHRLIETLPMMLHDPNRPEDVLKVDIDEDGNGGDDSVDCLRYLVMCKVGATQSYASGGSRENILKN